jgi:hypothetical protein
MEPYVYLQNLQIGFEDYLSSERRNRHVDHLEVEAQVGEEPGHCWIPTKASIT